MILINERASDNVVTSCTSNFTVQIGASFQAPTETVNHTHMHRISLKPPNSKYTLDCLVPTQDFIGDQIGFRLFPERSRRGHDSQVPYSSAQQNTVRQKAEALDWNIRNKIGRFVSVGEATTYTTDGRAELQAEMTIFAQNPTTEAKITVLLPSRLTVPITAQKVSKSCFKVLMIRVTVCTLASIPNLYRSIPPGTVKRQRYMGTLNALSPLWTHKNTSTCSRRRDRCVEGIREWYHLRKHVRSQPGGFEIESP